MMPKLFTLARPVLAEGAAAFLSQNGLSWAEDSTPTDAERLVEFSGRICYMSFGQRQYRNDHRSYLSNLIEQRHDSVLEHANWTFLITQVSRAFTHQLVRHRAGFSYSQLSQQYHDEVDADFVMPSEVRNSSAAKVAWNDAITAAHNAYKVIQAELEASPKFSSKRENLRSARSAARSVLPNATQTSIVVTANARAYRHFLDVRGSIEGDEEMRRVAFLFYSALHHDAPSLVADFTASRYSDGSPSVLRKKKQAVSL